MLIKVLKHCNCFRFSDMPSLICCPPSFILIFVQSFIWEAWDFQDHQNSGRWAEFPWSRPSFSVCGTFLKSLVWYLKNNLKEWQMNNALYKQVYKKRLYILHGALYNGKNSLWFFCNCQISLSTSSIFIKIASRLHGSFLLTWKCVKKIILQVFLLNRIL